MSLLASNTARLPHGVDAMAKAQVLARRFNAVEEAQRIADWVNSEVRVPAANL
ncbi:hypothetical protein [Paraburkholderia hiiakae]|uniref:hypothetical protein n=1 Tax=Paraburkholderia hiiakae TaxID=1081782 RepID=UPI0019192540|nr:hypothetical protein [Paraburkholderia hiiakae]